ncbi:hypothetical protein NliqN6_0661 [Naganishia liquefaciens]|uniref:Mitochondrial carrier protein n=1 Tax=Naganishia liquefaciens TaxID=104408 RepID=A0A8H3TQ37_9TREE|nr:hypothetical protein NliqN6_0661 [Naganishia liquefaciens]
MAAPSTAQAPSSPTESAEPDALVALSVAQAVPIPADMVVTESLPTATGQLRVDFPLEDDMDTEGEPERGPATAWVKENQLMLTYFVAGGLAGAASRTVVSPLERLKIILQVQPRDTGRTKGPASSSRAQGKAYGGVWDSLVRMYREEGFAGFMKGNGINCARIIPYSAVQFTTYEALKTWLKTYSGEENLSTPWRLTAGACAGIASVVSTYPLDLVRSRISIATASIDMRKPSVRRDAAATATASSIARSSSAGARPTVLDRDLGIWGMTKKVYRTEGGLKGLYRGTLTTAAGVAPYVALNFYFYEGLKAHFIAADDSTANKSLRMLLCGAAAGSVAQTLTYPFDVLRRKMQVAGMDGLSPAYTGALDAMVKITRAEGWWNGMYRGLWPNLLKVAPSMATSFFVYETVKTTITDHIQTL